MALLNIEPFPEGSNPDFGSPQVQAWFHKLFNTLNTAASSAPSDASYLTAGDESSSLTESRQLAAGTNITFVDGGPGATLTISASSSGAPTGAQYVTLALDGALSAERVLTAGAGISISDGGANGNVTINSTLNDPEYLVLTADAELTNERVLTAGANVSFVDGGPGGALTISSTGGSTSINLFARAYLGTAANTAATGWQKVPIDTVAIDPSTLFDATNNLFTPTEEGYYLCSLRAKTSTAGILEVAVGLNDVEERAVGAGFGTAVLASGGSALIFCNGSTDTLSLFINATSVVALTTGLFDTWMEILGPVFPATGSEGGEFSISDMELFKIAGYRGGF